MNQNILKEKIIIITNPMAGKGRNKYLLKKVKNILLKNTSNLEHFESKDSDHAERIANEYALLGHTIVACGGDGHVNKLANIASKLNVKFGIIPTGSGNDYASSIGIKGTDNIVSAIINNQFKIIDLWRLNEKTFCSIANIGFSSYANNWANQHKYLSGKTLYYASVFKTILNFSPINLNITIDNKTFEKKSWLVAIANSNLFGGGMNIAPYACPNDGYIDIVIVGAVSKTEFLKTFPKVYKGEHINHPSISYFRGKKIIIESINSNKLPVFADGENFGSLPINIKISDYKLKQLVPK